ncbi:MAG: tRNA 2-thiouridine(34) synthase MnmA [Ruminococcaceae bacterium]|nr:tRNA 2-thiouridine(34) synthase MnmA [Oscillospiraceae bacterium]
MDRQIVLGLSGGMDSAYAAIQLLNAGYDVTAVYALMHDSCDGTEEARTLAQALNIKFITVDKRESFEESVILPFVSDYVSGRTPNPCVRCNPIVKFKALLEVADRLGIEKIATGHYAKPCLYNGRYCFAPSADKSKDQCYFLYGLGQEAIRRVLMPLADVLKSDIKEYFANNNGYNFKGGESTDICFAAEGYRNIIASHAALPPEGDFVDLEGRVLGRHKGLHNYTVGQRKGLGIALGKPAFVKALDAQNNRVVLSFAEDFISATFRVKDINCMAVPTVNVGDRFDVKVRYRAVAVKCTVADITDGVFTVSFDTAQKPPATGQSAVFYIDDLVAFGGIIC